jgi:hypothetical protein
MTARGDHFDVLKAYPVEMGSKPGSAGFGISRMCRL